MSDQKAKIAGVEKLLALTLWTLSQNKDQFDNERTELRARADQLRRKLDILRASC